jgi:hypothetical protein
VKEVNELIRDARRQEALRRAGDLGDGPARGADAPAARSHAGGQKLKLRQMDGLQRWCLGDRALSVGDPIEVYTNRANGWLRGRFEWSGRATDRPRVSVNLWDPDGEADADGLPPWVGELVADIPVHTVVR